jgi:pimeloyl-ACP methyl ester carboxylesterase
MKASLCVLTILFAAFTPCSNAAEGHYAPVNGLKMYYEIHGVSDGRTPPLVLLHGGGSTIETTFGKFLPLLARSRQVIAFEQQGHGRTADVDRPFTFEGSADDAAALLQYLKIERADFFGYSNGGTIALQIAIRHPKLVRKLIVVSGMFRRDGVSPQFWEGMRHAKLADMPAELREAYLEVAPHPEQLQSFHDKSVRRMLDFQDIPTETIHGIEAPTMVMIGDADVVRPEHAVEMFRVLPHAQLAILPATDHMTIVKNAEPEAAMIMAFLDAPMPAK